MSIDGKVVAIAGAAGGLGPTVARAFAEAGARLAVAGRKEAELIRLLDGLRLPDDRRLATAVDLTDAEAARDWAAQITLKFGHVDVVLHLVGGYKGGTSIADVAAEDWEFTHDFLIKTVLNVARAFVLPLKSNGWGRFLTVTSPLAQRPAYKNAIYSTGKAAADALVLSLADELRGSGATANAIVANSIVTPQMRAANPGADYRQSTSAEDIAAAMLYLCSDEAAGINGARIPLAG